MADVRDQIRRYVQAELSPPAHLSAAEIIATRRARAHSRHAMAVTVAAALVVIAASSWIVLTSSSNDDVRVSSPARSRPLTWTQVATPPAPLAGTALAGSRHGVVLVGDDIWFSRDGEAWRPAIMAEPAPSRNPLQGHANDVTSSSSGYVAGGFAVDPDGGPLIPAIWKSSDGVHWERVLDPELKSDVGTPSDTGPIASIAGIEAIAARGSHLVAVGVSYTGHRAVWVSDDNGAHWQRVRALGELGMGKPGLRPPRDLVAYRGRFVAIVKDSDHTMVYESRSGAGWRRVATIPGQLQTLVVGRGALVAGGDGSIFRSTDGRSWRRVHHLTRPLVPQFASGAFSDGQLVIVGHRFEGRRPAAALLATSRDGKTWNESASDRQPFKGPGKDLFGIAAFRHRFFIVGFRADPGDPITHPEYFVSSRV